MKDPSEAYFDCTDAERAAFEAGIKLGSIYHQFVGTPVSPQNADILARSIEESTRLQPFVETIRVRIDLNKGQEKGVFPYRSLAGEMLEVDLRVRYRDAVAVSQLRYEEPLLYPLMRLREMHREESAADAPPDRG